MYDPLVKVAVLPKRPDLLRDSKSYNVHLSFFLVLGIYNFGTTMKLAFFSQREQCGRGLVLRGSLAPSSGVPWFSLQLRRRQPQQVPNISVTSWHMGQQLEVERLSLLCGNQQMIHLSLMVHYDHSPNRVCDPNSMIIFFFCPFWVVTFTFVSKRLGI